MGFYSRHIAPWLVDCACGTKPIAYQRRKIVPRAEGVVLEIGAGGGRNFALYDPAKVTKLIALEPDPEMVKRGKARTPQGLAIDWIERGAEEAGVEPGSVDTLLTTFTLCTIPDAIGALSALRGVLKPGGKLLFCEHGLAPDADVQKWQRRIEPVWKPLAGGCHLTRDVGRMLADAGWRTGQIETMYLPGTPRFAGYNTWGDAVPA
ncbi:MAG: methyltransferase domain-containing protein [Alphaproteobacteria bacterium]|nr:methyltransferase domain-containing protein [Alphaproteobacteria bacterium]